MKTLCSMRAALADDELLGTVLVGPSWDKWRIKLIAAAGEPLTDDERVVFAEMTGGREREPLERVEIDVDVTGRRGGKDRKASVQAVHSAALICYRDVLADGERGVVLVLAQNQKQASVAFGYIAAIFERVPKFKAMVTNVTADTISLNNQIDISIRAASFRGLRGPTYVHAILDEIAFFHVDGSANPDDEIVNAILPGLATTGGMMTLISSPYARRGVLYEFYRDHYGPNGDPRILVSQGSSRYFNPTLRQSIVDRAMAKDPERASAEWLAQFRSDLEDFVGRELVESLVERGVERREPLDGVTYLGGCDPSGGAKDSMTGAVAHLEGRKLVLDATMEIKAPFSPEAATAKLANELFKPYRVSTIKGDRYAGTWPSERFAANGIKYVPSELTRSEIYLAVLPEMTSGNVALLDNPRLVVQLAGLERRTSRSGKDAIDHKPGSKDDVVNSAAIALLMAKPNAVQEIPVVAAIQVSATFGDVSNGGFAPAPGFISGGHAMPNERW